jgi:hypothetical protein
MHPAESHCIGAAVKLERPMTHEELLNMIKAAIKQLADDKSVPQRQTIRELKEIQTYVESAIPNVSNETAERND